MNAGLKNMLIILLLAAWSTCGSAEEGNGVRRHGALRVDGFRLVDQRGDAVQLRGMSSHGLHWFPEYASYPSILETKKRGANLFRLAMYADSIHGGYSESAATADLNKRLVLQGMENALAADMYVIVDWHLLEDENPLRLVDKALPFFEEITRRYPDHPAILYEICNEPNGETTWKDIRDYAEKVIPVIRRLSPNAIVLVGTPHHSADVLAVMESPLGEANIMYTYHLYTGFGENDFAPKLDAMRAAELPVFVSEWGLSTDAETGDLDVDEAGVFLAYMRAHSLSWANWSLSNKDEVFSAIRPEVTKLSGWREEDLTISGKIIFAAFKD